MSATDAAPRGAPLDLAPPDPRPAFVVAWPGAAATAGPPHRPSRLAAALRLLPALAVVAAGWAALAAMLAPAVADRLAPLAWAGGLLAGGADAAALVPALATLCRSTGEAATSSALAAMWTAMAATMLPGAARGWRLLRTAPDWRDGYGFLAGHLAVWVCAATAAAAADVLLAAWPEARAAAVPLVAMLAAVHRVGMIRDPRTRICPFLSSRGDDAPSQPSGPIAPLRDGLGCGVRGLTAHAPLVGLMAVAGMTDLGAMAAAGGAAAVGRRGSVAAGTGAAMLAGFALWRLAAGG